MAKKKMNIGAAVKKVVMVTGGAVTANLLDERVLATSLANLDGRIKAAGFLVLGIGLNAIGSANKSEELADAGIGVGVYGGVSLFGQLMNKGEVAGLASPYQQDFVGAGADEMTFAALQESGFSGADDLPGALSGYDDMPGALSGYGDDDVYDEDFEDDEVAGIDDEDDFEDDDDF